MARNIEEYVDVIQAERALNCALPVNLSGKLTSTSSIKSSSTSGGVGYDTGAGGAITQATSKATGVTLNRVTGVITMNNESLNGGAEALFSVTNSVVGPSDVIIINHASAGTSGAYLVGIAAVAQGSFAVSVSNTSGGALGEAIVLNFAVIKGANA
jgi:hypothetical protein